MFKFDGFVKSPLGPLIVIPAKAGIQSFQAIMDSRFHWNDKVGVSGHFYEVKVNTIGGVF